MGCPSASQLSRNFKNIMFSSFSAFWDTSARSRALHRRVPAPACLPLPRASPDGLPGRPPPCPLSRKSNDVGHLWVGPEPLSQAVQSPRQITSTRGKKLQVVAPNTPQYWCVSELGCAPITVHAKSKFPNPWLG